MKKILLSILLTLLLINSANSANYNSSYSNLTIEDSGWCANLPITFTIYNLTERELNKADKDYTNYSQITGVNLKIYDGPLSSLKILQEVNSLSTNQFNQTFEYADNYLIEITAPSGSGYNDYTKLFEVQECKHINEKVIVTQVGNYTPSKKLYNQTFEYYDITVQIQNTDMTNKTNITIKNINGLAPNGLTELKETTKSFAFNTKSNVYTNLDLTINNINQDLTKTTKAYYYENNAWTNVAIETTANQVILKNPNQGIYAITQETIITQPQITEIKNETTNLNSETTNLNQNSENTQTTNNNPQSTQTLESTKNNEDNNQIENTPIQTINYTPIIIGIILTIIMFGIILMITKKKKTPKNNINDVNIGHVEILNSYNQIYSNTKKYVQTYKTQYSKDQIYRALEQVNIPRDIIDKVFLEEYH